MLINRPAGFPESWLPSQHQFLSQKWDSQHKVPDGASEQVYDVARKVLVYVVDGEQHELETKTPPVWVGKIGRELNNGEDEG